MSGPQCQPMPAGALRCAPFGVPARGLARARARVQPRLSAKKGFAGEGADGPQLKINERGKVASRSGPVSRKQLDRIKSDGEAKQQQMRAEQGPAAVGAAPPPPGGPPARETPQVVVDRMLRRIMLFTGVPVGLGLGMLVLFAYLKLVVKLEYPLWLVYVSQVLLLGGSLGGITYGIISSSWEPGREGSFWGWTEAKGNLPLLLNRNKK